MSSALVDRIALQLNAAKFMPTIVLTMNNGGSVLMSELGKAIHVSSDRIVGVPIWKSLDPYRYDIAEWFKPLMGHIVKDEFVLVFDDSCSTGELVTSVASRCERLWGARDARSGVIIRQHSEGDSTHWPNFWVESRPAPLKKFKVVEPE